MARVSMAASTPSRGAGRSRWMGAATKPLAPGCSTSRGPPRPATMRAKASAARPLARACSACERALVNSVASPPKTKAWAARLSVSSSTRGSRDRTGSAPTRKSIASCTSKALPALRPSTWFMSVTRAVAGSPRPPATCTRLRANSVAWPRSAMKAPLPHFTSSTRPCRPAASFLLRMLAMIKGIDSTVAVTSRMAYRRRSAGARSALAPTMTQPAWPSTASNCSRGGSVW